MWISKKEMTKLSTDVRKIIDGQVIDLRTNKEGAWGLLRNDIHTLAGFKSEQVTFFHNEYDLMADTLSNISHQLKTPLTSTIIMADLLEDAPLDKQKEFISNIQVSLMQMDWLVSTLLKMANLDAGVITFLPEKMMTSALLKIALNPLHILLDVKNQQIEVSGDTALFCDKQWTAEAITNVLKNASEHSPVDSTIIVNFGENPICKWIAITDSGRGIAKTEVGKVFKRFEGAKSAKGHGIGLPLALAIMKGQNGDIDVDGGGDDSGATFTLKFFK